MIYLVTVYLLGYVWFWRYHVGFIAHDFNGGYGKLDADDMAAGLMLGSMTTLVWPITVSGRLVYVAWKKNVNDEPESLERWFPAAREIETKSERQERTAREAQEQIHRRRWEINSHERANGLELTRWTE